MQICKVYDKKNFYGDTTVDKIMETEYRQDGPNYCDVFASPAITAVFFH